MGKSNLIDLTPIRARTVQIRATVGGEERTWQLSDQVPSEVLLPVFDLWCLDDEVKAATAKGSEGTREDVRTARDLMEQIYEQTTAILADIFRCSYPETTEADVRAWFPVYVERRRIVELFFGLSGSRLPDATSDSTSDDSAPQESTKPTTQTGAGTMTANRATRRASARSQSRGQ